VASALRLRAGRRSDTAFLAAGALAFAASAASTVAWCASMSGGMPMPGGWSMSMAWMRMPGQGPLAAAAAFLAMWLLMMAAMMLPSLVAMLSRYRLALRRYGERGLALPTALAAAGYFAAWTGVGALLYPLGALLAAAEMRSPALARAVPLASGAALMIAGLVQLTPWKLERLLRCRDPLACCGTPRADARGAWRQGLRLGAECCLCCAGLIAALVVLGVMDLRAMGLVTAAITAERVSPWPRRVARATGILLAVAGLAWSLRSV
jgi:predicted metal-binding membrane protein